MRTEQETYMPELVDIVRRVLTDDGFGGYDETSTTTVATNVPARIIQGHTFTTLGQMSRDVELAQWTVRVPIGTDVKDEDTVVCSARGVQFRVTDIKPKSFDTVMTLACEFVK